MEGTSALLGAVGGRPREWRGFHAGALASPGWARAGRARGCARSPVPTRPAPPRSPFWLPEGAAWCMMQHRGSKRGRPGRAVMPAGAPYRDPGAGSQGVGGWWARGSDQQTSGDLPLHGAVRSTPPRHEVRDVSSATVRSPPCGREGGPAAGGPPGTALAPPHPCRGAHLSFTLDPGPPTPLDWVPRVILGKTSLGGLPCDPTGLQRLGSSNLPDGLEWGELPP